MVDTFVIRRTRSTSFKKRKYRLMEDVVSSPMIDSIEACTHRDEYRRALFTSVFQRVFCVHTQAIFADDEPSEHANSFPDIRWHLM